MRNKGACLGCGLALLACVGLTGAAWYLAFGRPESPERVADRFVTQLGRGHADEASRDASRVLRDRMTPGMLLLHARRLGVVSLGEIAWSEVAVADHEVSFEGAVTNEAGDDLLLLVVLVHEEESWRVLSLAAALPQTTTDVKTGDGHEQK